MLSYIWSFLIVFAIIYASVTQGGENVVTMLNNAIQNGAELFLTIAPLMCFWSGIMEITERSGITRFIARLLSPLTKILFPSLKNDDEALGKICMNMSANLLGMGNAATPLGLCAMEHLDKINPAPAKASDAMCMFVIINTASIQIIPSSVITLRAAFGSETPADILPAVWLTTLSAFIVGIFSAKLCSGGSK